MSLLVVGHFCLSNGRQEVVNKIGPSGNHTSHAFIVYDVPFRSTQGPAAPANIRIYGGPNGVPLMENTVAFAIAQAFVTADGSVRMDASFLVPVPGDPDDDTYEDGIPDVPIPFIFGVGQVMHSVPSTPQNSISSFQVSVSEYVRDARRFSTIK